MKTFPLMSLGAMAFSHACVALVVCLALFLAPNALMAPATLLVEPGLGTRQIIQKMRESGQLREPFGMIILSHLLNAPLQAGEYQVRPKQSSASIFGMLWRGEGVLRQLTIPEGLTSYQIVHIINTAPAMVGQITTLPPEGSLLPETYRYSYGTSRYDMMQTMQQHMQKTIAHLWEKRPSNYPLQTMQHFVTLASIVEKETGVAAERARVAGVFINRLRMGMKLQSDPTVIYGLSEGKGFLDRPLLRKDWLHQHPINTYVIDGLPPQPIANPGLAALQATLSPETHDLIYFVADGTGGHVFASNLKDHNTNVAAWQKINAKKNSP